MDYFVEDEGSEMGVVLVSLGVFLFWLADVIRVLVDKSFVAAVVAGDGIIRLLRLLLDIVDESLNGALS